MDKYELESRTKKFAVDVIRFVRGFERSTPGRVIGHQLLKSATSIGANYREANRAGSRRDFSYKIIIIEKEASESSYWLEICLESSLGSRDSCSELLEESRELLAIFTAIGRSLRTNDNRSTRDPDFGVAETEPLEYRSGVYDTQITDLVPTE